MWAAFPPSDYYDPSAPPRRHQPATGLPAGQRAADRGGTAGAVPTFTTRPFDGVGAQLCPCGLATATPQPFTVASLPATSNRLRSSPPKRVRAATQPRSVRFELVVRS
jgi:hypothetical protein